MNDTLSLRKLIKKTRYGIFLLCLIAMPTAPAAGASLSFAPGQRELAIDYAFATPDPTKQLAGFRLYKDGTEVCASSDLAASSLDCVFNTEDGSFDFTLTAYYADNTESPASTVYPFVVSSTHSVDFTWNATSSWSTRGGFRIYDNGVLLQEITDTSARQFTYTGEFSSADHTYTITAVDRYGRETPLSGALTSSEIFPPKAVVSSSTGAGNAPLTVAFDGSSSSATNATIAGYSWDFGDGSQASGAKVSHVYNTPGTFSARLTVKDSRGLTGTVSTPIVVGQAGGGGNQQPTPAFSVDLGQGGDPLTVAFDGTKSSDSDGSIVDYRWDFGDGSTGSGATVQHAYAASGSYSVTLQVTDDKGATAATTGKVQVGGQVPMEVGEVSLDNQWVKVLFEGTYSDPVVIAGPPTTTNEDQPVTVRIRNVDSQGFEIRLQEWDYQDGTHAAETVNYLVMERGTHTLANGGKVEAGSFTGGSAFARAALLQTYAAAPVILSQVVSANEADAVTGRVRNVTGKSFEYKLQEMEKTATEHTEETIDYIAWEPGTGEVSGFLYESAVGGQRFNQDWAGLGFATTFPAQPALLAGMQTDAGDDTATVRCRNFGPAAVEARIEEEQSRDGETRHAGEAVGYLVIAPAAAQP